MVNAIILNDTTRNKGHFGCSEVMENIEYLCKANDINIIASYQKPAAYHDKNYSNMVKKSDIVIINGEGTMHHDQVDACHLLKSAEIAKKANKKCFLINTVWQENTNLNKSLGLFDEIFVRESHSLKEIERAGFTGTIVPDLSLYQRKVHQVNEQKNKGDTIYFDSVNWGVTKKLATLAAHNKKSFYMLDGDYLKKVKTLKLLAILLPRGIVPRQGSLKAINSSNMIISGRFHALCIAIKYSVPCIAVSSNTHKVEALLQDIGLQTKKYLIKHDELDTGIAAEKIKKFQPSKVDTEKIKLYLSSAQHKIEEMFKGML